MLTEKKLKVGEKYLYWSSSKLRHMKVVYEGKRQVTELGEDIFVFRDSLTLNEVWAQNLINIAVDHGWKKEVDED